MDIGHFDFVLSLFFSIILMISFDLFVHLIADIADQCLDIVHHLVKVLLLGD